MKNTTKIKIPKKYQQFITDVWYEGKEDGYWAYLIECCYCEDTDCHFVHEWTQKDFLRSLRSIIILNPKDYVYIFGSDNLDDYYESLKMIGVDFNEQSA